jgi:hypothetical protein
MGRGSCSSDLHEPACLAVSGYGSRHVDRISTKRPAQELRRRLLQQRVSSAVHGRSAVAGASGRTQLVLNRRPKTNSTCALHGIGCRNQVEKPSPAGVVLAPLWGSAGPSPRAPRNAGQHSRRCGGHHVATPDRQRVGAQDRQPVPQDARAEGTAVESMSSEGSEGSVPRAARQRTATARTECAAPRRSTQTIAAAARAMHRRTAAGRVLCLAEAMSPRAWLRS